MFLTTDIFVLSFSLFYQDFSYTKNKTGGYGSTDYLLSRVKRLYPEYVFAAVLSIVSFGIVHPDFDLVKAVTELLMLQNSGLFMGGYNTPCWYVSALVIVSVIIYGCLSVNRNLYVRVIAPLLVFCGYAYFFKTAGGLEQWGVELFVPMTLLRAACGLSLGVLVAAAAEQKRLLNMNRFAATVVELGCLGFIVYGLTARDIGFLLILCFAVLIFVAVSNRSYISSSLLNHRIFDKTASISYAVYLNQRVCIYGVALINDRFLHIDDKIIFVYLAVLIVYSIVTHKAIQTVVSKFENRKLAAAK